MDRSKPHRVWSPSSPKELKLLLDLEKEELAELIQDKTDDTGRRWVTFAVAEEVFNEKQ